MEGDNGSRVRTTRIPSDQVSPRRTIIRCCGLSGLIAVGDFVSLRSGRSLAADQPHRQQLLRATIDLDISSSLATDALRNSGRLTHALARNVDFLSQTSSANDHESFLVLVRTRAQSSPRCWHGHIEEICLAYRRQDVHLNVKGPVFTTAAGAPPLHENRNGRRTCARLCVTIDSK